MRRRDDDDNDQNMYLCVYLPSFCLLQPGTTTTTTTIDPQARASTQSTIHYILYKHHHYIESHTHTHSSICYVIDRPPPPSSHTWRSNILYIEKLSHIICSFIYILDIFRIYKIYEAAAAAWWSVTWLMIIICVAKELWLHTHTHPCIIDRSIYSSVYGDFFPLTKDLELDFFWLIINSITFNCD